jgi:hypothetical protein
MPERAFHVFLAEDGAVELYPSTQINLGVEGSRDNANKSLTNFR